VIQRIGPIGRRRLGCMGRLMDGNVLPRGGLGDGKIVPPGHGQQTGGGDHNECDAQTGSERSRDDRQQADNKLRDEQDTT
jgi:hypothetical protein